MKKLLVILFFVAFATHSYGQTCQAAFTYNTNPASLYLTDLSYNTDSSAINVSTWVWTVSFGGSMTTYTTQNPTIPTYGYSGPVQVCLSISTFLGCNSSFCDTIYITSTTTDTCMAYFTYYTDSIPSAHVYNFYDQSTTGNGTINSWSWVVSYGGSVIETSTTQNPIITFATAGAYDVCLTIGSDSGCSNTTCQTVYVLDSNSSCQPTVTAVINQVSVIGGNDGSIDLTVTGGTPPYTFDWSTGAITEDINNLTSGVYWVNISSTPACPTYTYTYQILEPYDSLNTYVDTLYTLPIDTCLGFPVDSFYISSISVSGSTVTVYWVFTGGGMVTTLAATYTFTDYGSMVVVLSIDCGGFKNLTTYMSYIHINAPSGIVDINAKDQINVYPNPATDFINVDFGTQTDRTTLVKIYSSTGQEIVSKTVAPNTNQIEINVNKLAGGIYFMQIDNGNGKPIVKKFFK